MGSKCDLHTHSYYSDGSYSPAQLIQAAQEIGLSAVVLCDHNTVKGLPEFIAAAENSPVEAVPGIEFSTEYWGKELHIIGMYIQPKHYEAVEALLQQFLLRKEKSNIDLVEGLKKAGMELDYQQIKTAAAGQINRAVIAAEMVRKGYCESVKQAFDTVLGAGAGYYVPPVRPDPLETVRFIKSIGAVAVLAHPFLSMDEALLHTFLQEAVPAGLDGMEVYYPKYDAKTTARAGQIAKQYGLLESGGSDFHGSNKPDIALGTGRNNLEIPLLLLEKLKKRAEKGAVID